MDAAASEDEDSLYPDSVSELLLFSNPVMKYPVLSSAKVTNDTVVSFSANQSPMTGSVVFVSMQPAVQRTAAMRRAAARAAMRVLFMILHYRRLEIIKVAGVQTSGGGLI